MTINYRKLSDTAESNNKNIISFFNTINLVFESNSSFVDRFYEIGGFTVKLHFAGKALISFLTPAIEHLSISPCSNPSLTINIWDSESTNTKMPTPPWELDDYSARGEIMGYNNNRFFTACNKGSGALSMLDIEANLGLWWIRSKTNFPFYESGSPLLTLFHWWLQKNGRQVVHAGAVGKESGGVLLVGKGGSGKSTTTISCLNSDLFYAGDDYSILSSSPVPYVYSLYSSGKLNADHIKNFQHLVPLIHNADRTELEKPLLFFNQYYHDKIITGFPIKAIMLPRITGKETTSLTPASSAVGLMALAPSTLFQLSNATQSAFFQISRFIKQVPCYYLNLGTQINKIPEVISMFLKQN